MNNSDFFDKLPDDDKEIYINTVESFRTMHLVYRACREAGFTADEAIKIIIGQANAAKH